MPAKSKATERIDLKATPPVKDLIDRGAAAVNKSRSEFMLEAATLAAQEAIMSQTSFPLDPNEWDEFNRILNEQPWEDDPGHRKLMETQYSWK